MTTERSRFSLPSTAQLLSALTTVLRHNQVSTKNIRLLARSANPRKSTFPTEIVNCRVDGEHERKTISLFVKYGGGQFDPVYGHRGNLSYEAKVYRQVLQGLNISTPKFYGLYRNATVANPWLILEYIDGGYPASWLKDPQAMLRSARWIGKFHSLCEKRIREKDTGFLHRYDEAYFTGWSLRTKRLFKGVRSEFPWLAPLCTQFERHISTLVRGPQTIIHGEYFGDNIVNQSGVTRPIDWQSTAIGAGEIDLASLTHSWVNKVVKECEREYVKSRWPKGAPESFRRKLEVARLYMDLRWLGDPLMMRPLVTSQGKLIAKKNVFTAMQALLDINIVGRRIGLIA